MKRMEEIDKIVNWDNVEALLMEHYDVGKSKEWAGVYLPFDVAEVV